MNDVYNLKYNHTSINGEALTEEGHTSAQESMVQRVQRALHDRTRGASAAIALAKELIHKCR